ncbi:MAG: hypothetical protein ABH954_04740, partial [Candidatus Omnitrophota bacterium]
MDHKDPKRKRLSTKRAQALLELAIIVPIILLCLVNLIRTGMKYNYQQRLEMKTYRDVIAKAHATKGDLKGYAETVIEHKHIPDPAHPFGIGSVQPFYSGQSGVWSNMLMANIRPTNWDTHPRTQLYIDGQHVTHKDSRGIKLIAMYDSYAPIDVYVKINDYPTSLDPNDLDSPFSDLYIQQNGPRSYDYVRRAEDELGDGIYWRWFKVECRNTAGRGYAVPYCAQLPCDEDEEDECPFQKNFDPPSNVEKTLYSGSVADIDGDFKEEYIARIYGSCYDTGKYSCRWILVWDYNRGEIDSTIDSVDIGQGKKYQGLQPGYTI